MLVAAQRDMVERLLGAVRRAGLTPEGVDLSAFALIRSLYRARPRADRARVLYLNVDGLTNLAIAEGTICRFTRVVGGGLEGMAAELAERAASRSPRRARCSPPSTSPRPAPRRARRRAARPVPTPSRASEPQAEPEDAGAEPRSAARQPRPERRRRPAHEESADEQRARPELEAPAEASAPTPTSATVLENGIREISGEVRNSLDFHRSQDGGGEVSHVVLSGAAQDIPGFAEALQAALGVEVARRDVGVVGERPRQRRLRRTASRSPTGLAAAEAPR